jgi:predicted nucleic acid-binding Zn ribbon protein
VTDERRSDESSDQVDPAAVALARVRTAAKSKKSAQSPSKYRSYRSGPVGGFSGPGPDARDPRLLGPSLDSWAADRGFQSQLTVAGLTSRWAEIVGELVASHVTADEYHRMPIGGRLVITADSPGWESTMKYQTETIKRRIAEELGSGLVTVIEVRGLGRSRRKGWRVQTGRRR